MFQLNPHHLENASLLHFLMLQGAAVLSYLIGRQLYRRRLEQLVDRLNNLQARIDTVSVVTPQYEIAGITPKAEQMLNAVGIYRFGQLAQLPVDTLQHILTNHGPRLYSYDPVTWPMQAQLAYTGRWIELRRWQEQMRRGNFTDFRHLLS